MSKFVVPRLFGLPSSTKLNQFGVNQFDLVILRKSRIIMNDGERILAKVTKIKNQAPNANVNLRTSAPVCSKTKTFLIEHGIRVLAC